VNLTINYICFLTKLQFAMKWCPPLYAASRLQIAEPALSQVPRLWKFVQKMWVPNFQKMKMTMDLSTYLNRISTRKSDDFLGWLCREDGIGWNTLYNCLMITWYCKSRWSKKMISFKSRSSRRRPVTCNTVDSDCPENSIISKGQRTRWSPIWVTMTHVLWKLENFRGFAGRSGSESVTWLRQYSWPDTSLWRNG